MKLILILTLGLCLGFTDRTLPGQLDLPEIQTLLGPYPALETKGSDEDFSVILDWQSKRTQADCAVAESFAGAQSIEKLFGPPTGPLSSAEIQSIPSSVGDLKPAISLNNRRAKEFYQRPRPYFSNPLVQPCIDREDTFAYPSGHATYSRAMARILATIFPHKALALLERADQVALSRVQGGVHHPSDIEAGKKLGDEVARRLILTLPQGPSSF